MQKKLPLINSAHGSETRNIINELIKLFNGMGYTYDEALSKAHNILIEAQKTNNMNKDVQQQINTLIAESGTSDAELLQARIDGDGNEYSVLKDRLDAKEGSFSVELSGKSTKSELYSDLPTPKSISLSANGNNRVPFISFVDDDGFLQYYNVMAPMLEERGFTGTAAIITSTTGTSGRMTVDHLRDLQQRGFELASHTHDHLGFQSDGLTPDEIEYQCKHSKELMVSWGLQVNNLVYRGGQSGGDVAIERVKKYYRSGVITNTAANNDQHRELKDEYRILRVNAQGNTLQSLKDNVDYCLANNTWLIFMTHAHGHSATENVIIGQLLDYIKTKNVAVGTLNEGLDLFGNTFSVGSKEYIKILAGGQIYSNAIGTVFKNPSDGYSIDLNTPADYFEYEKITISRISDTDKLNLPFKNYGFLETFASRLAPTNTHQVWRPSGTDLEYRRNWRGTYTLGSWGEWYVQKGTLPFQTPSFQLAANGKHQLSVSLVEQIGSAATTSRIPFNAQQRTAVYDNVIFNTRIALGVLYINVFNPNSTIQNVGANDWHLTILGRPDVVW